ncbi:MAG: hypothetical protein J7576_03655 [Siphonobacter aquaeclarae]|nr:hypothetical protein [Siphonobacter aquaeclarae]
MTLTAYLLQVSLALAGFAGLYILLLQRETYYRWNRLYFWIAGAGAFLLPFAGQWYSREAEVQTYVPDLSFRFDTLPVAETTGPAWQWPDVLQAVWVAGMVWMGVRLVHQLVQLFRIRLSAGSVAVAGRRLLIAPGHTDPFSFFGWIFVHPGQYTAKELEEVIRHEEIHAAQRHSLDVLLVEAMQVVLWFNPVAWWWGKAVRQNLEFLADHDVLASGMEARHYQYHLLRQSGMALPVTNQFNVSELKNRIRQINTPDSARWKLVKLLGALPMLAFLTMAFAPRQVTEEVERSLDVMRTSVTQKESTPGRKDPARPVLRTMARPVIVEDTVPAPPKPVRIELRSAPHPAVSDNLSPEHPLPPQQGFTIQLYDGPNRKADPPLIIMEGKEVAYDKLGALDPNTIESINVLKGESGDKLYGEKAKNGVLIINLKKK